MEIIGELTLFEVVTLHREILKERERGRERRKRERERGNVLSNELVFFNI